MIFWYSIVCTDASTYLSTFASTGVSCFCLTHASLLVLSGVGVRQVAVEAKRKSKADGVIVELPVLSGLLCVRVFFFSFACSAVL